MRIILLLAFATILAGCNSVKEKYNTAIFKDCGVVTLKFYVVSKRKIPNGVYIDTKKLPKVGYIKSSPELELKRVKYADCRLHHEISYFEGKKTDNGLIPYLTITLKNKDKAVFEKLTATNIGKRILMIIGSKIIDAPEIVNPITTGTIGMRMAKDTNCKEIQKELDKLVQ